MQNFFNKTPDEALSELGVPAYGLTNEEAAKRKTEYGENALTEQKKKSPIVVFLEQFKDLLVIILIVAAIISAFTGSLESTFVIIAVIILNAILGTVQHFKAEKSLASLKALSSPTAKVVRNAKTIEIPSREVVPGDVIVQEAGDLIVADARIIENYSLQVNESSLTGESENVTKTVEALTEDKLPLGDQTNMIFSGSFVTYGHALGVVTGTGMNTEIGKIASLMNQTKEKKTPLQISLDNFSKKLAILIIVICAVVFGLEVYRSMDILNALLFAVALAVAAIPEALSSIVTIVQAMGTQKMVKEHAIIKELKAVETLGSVSVICSDKTGTLTQNKMTVQSVYTDGSIKDYKDLNLDCLVDQYLMHVAVLTNDSIIDEAHELGDPTEIALVALANHYQIEETEIRKAIPRVAELPFDSERKLMSTAHRINDELVLLTKGALDVLISRTTNILTCGGPRKITEEDKQKILDVNQQMSENGLRVLAFVYKPLESERNLTLQSENDYTFIGLIAMIDPPREESIHAVTEAKRAGIKTVMITGDHKITASAIAKKIGIMQEGERAITGLELDQMSDEELQKNIENISVYARVSPEHKIRIVDAWQAKGRLTAMTGDGVNDAPALKKADIGVAMGITGTEVSKDAASMILTDDNFATIVKSVANGRNVYVNIKNSIKFLLSGNAAGILVVLYTAIMPHLPAPFLPVHLLFINLLTDSLPAIAIGMEKSQDDLLGMPPRDPKEHILNRKTLGTIGIQGLIIAIFTLFAFFIGLNTGGAALASTMAFCTLTLARLFHGFNCRGKKSIFSLKFMSNKYSVMAFFAGFILLSAVMFIPPLMSLFSVVSMSSIDVISIYLLAFCPTLIIQVFKLIRDCVEKRSSKKR